MQQYPLFEESDNYLPSLYNLNTLKYYCRKLCIFENLFIRCDFYISNKTILFGEFTPHPEGGMGYTPKFLRMLNKHFDENNTLIETETENNTLTKKQIDMLKSIPNLSYKLLSNNELIIKNKYKSKKIRLSGDCVCSINSICLSKNQQCKLYLKNNIPHPTTYIITKLTKRTTIDKNLKLIQYPIVIKPSNSYGGKGVFAMIENKYDAYDKIQILFKQGFSSIQIQKYIFGNEYRILVFKKNILLIYKKILPHIIGDGKSTIIMLIKNYNNYNISNSLKEAIYDAAHIKQLGYQMDDILEKHTILNIVSYKHPMNISLGSRYKIIPRENIHPDNIELFSNICNKIGYIYGGIDYISADISVSYKKNNAIILEINESPGLLVAKQNGISTKYILELWANDF